VQLTVCERQGVDRRGWPVTCGIPFHRDELPAAAIEAGRFRLLDADGSDVPCQAEVAATWGTYPAGSTGMVRWLHLTFLADVPAGGEAPYELEVDCDPPPAKPTGLAVDDAPETVTITTGSSPGSVRLTISKKRFNLLDDVRLDLAGDGFGNDDRLIAPRNEPNLWMRYEHRSARINANPPEVTVEEAGPVMAVVRVRTKLDERFESVVRVYAWARCPYVRVQETLIHGPTGQDRSAVRSQPVVMKAHVLELPVSVGGGEATVTVGVGEALPEPARLGSRTAPADGPVVLEQDLRHECVKDNVGPDLLNKAFHYELFAGEERVAAGARAPGWLDVSNARWGVTAAVRDFWQSFPKRLVGQANGLRVELWADGAQLDPVDRNFSWMGMARTHEVGLYFHAGDAESSGAADAALAHIGGLHAICEPRRYCSTGAYGHRLLTPADRPEGPVFDNYDEYLAKALNRPLDIPDGFHYFRQREDGYGYFNFGDFLVGPYWGCQEYDPAYCMLQQFYRTGELDYLEFAAETARCAYDVLYSHSYTPETSNYPQRSHDKSGSHFLGEDSHGQRQMNTDPGHVFLAGLANYWFLTGDRRARDVIFWSLPVYLGDDWYRISGGGTWRYLGGYLFTVFVYAYELTWDERYVEAMLWTARQYMVNGWSRHDDGVWWSRCEDGYTCAPWLADAVTNGYSQLLEVYPGCPYREAIESGIVKLADFMLAHGFGEDFDGLVSGQVKPTAASEGYGQPRNVYRKSMSNMAVVTMTRAYHLTGNQEYLSTVRHLMGKSLRYVGELNSLKGVCQGTYYAPMALPYLEGVIGPRDASERFEVVPPVQGWIEPGREILRASGRSGGPVFLGDELAAACAPASARGRSHGNSPGWRLPDVWAAVDAVLDRCDPRVAVLLIGGSDLPTGHPERTDFEANYTMLIRRLLSAGCLPIPATLPPCSHLEPFAWQYNAVIAQAACLHRLPLIDLRERMRAGFTPVNNEPAESKTPSAEWVAANQFAPGHAPIVGADLREILRFVVSP